MEFLVRLVQAKAMVKQQGENNGSWIIKAMCQPVGVLAAD